MSTLPVSARPGRGLGNQLMKPCLQAGEAQARTCPPVTFMLRAAH
jgi:hypothetical protein